MTPRISVVTSTYQRVAELPRLYESLLAQTWEDFEWVLIDDGSSDGTGDLVREWARSAPFPIEYHWQENRGMGIGRNRGIERARGEFCALIDSDDWYRPEALERMVAHWEAIPGERRGDFANVEGLRVDAHGELVGDRFPSDVFDSNVFELEAVHGVEGDKIGMYRRDVLLRFPFPEDLGWHVTPAVVWNRIAARYSSRFVNEIWAGTGYEQGGLSTRETELRLRYPDAQLLYWSEFAAMPRPMRRSARLRANANRVRYSLLTGAGLRGGLAACPHAGWKLAAAPLGTLLCLRDRRRMRTIAQGED
ncbi:MAG TPA: glycosyltransferase family 2 protein [Solirubrobacterales bacterium]|nr:glycosyltransferase family 2 protein [Solirubrobacterales bacterium]